MLNWIVCNRTVFEIKTVLRQIELFERKLFWYLTVWNKSGFVYSF